MNAAALFPDGGPALPCGEWAGMTLRDAIALTALHAELLNTANEDYVCALACRADKAGVSIDDQLATEVWETADRVLAARSEP